MSTSNNRHIRNMHVATWLLIFFCSSLFSASVFADEVTSKGTVLRGKVLSFSSAGVEFETEYGAGTISIPWENIEAIKTEGPFQVLYGEDQEIDAPIQGLSEGKLSVGESADTAIPIELGTIQSANPIAPEGLSFADRIQSRFRYWDGSLLLGLSLSQSTVDTTGLLIALKTSRIKDPTRFFLEGSYRYSTQKERDEDSTTLENELRGLARLEYDFKPRLYGFTSLDAENDKIEDLKIRLVPKAGLGYRLWVQQIDEIKENFLCALSDVPGYMVAQVVGAVVAALIVLFVKDFPPVEVATPNAIYALIAEFLFTFALCYVVLNTATSKNTAGNSFYGLAIGFTVVVGAYSVGAISSAALNPAVAVGITVMGLSSAANIQIFLVANFLGGAVAAIVFNSLNPDDK